MKLGIIGAMDLETELLVAKLENKKSEVVSRLTFYSGSLNGKEVVVVTSGIGKVNAAVCTQILISVFGVDGVVNTGVSGAIYPALEIGDIVISTACVQHDFDCTGFGYKPGVIPRMEEHVFKADERLVELAYNAGSEVVKDHHVFKGIVASGDQFISSLERRNEIDTIFNAHTTEMEGAAIAHACYLSGIPFVVIRSMSDKANGEAHESFEEFARIAAENSSRIVEQMLSQL